MVLDWEGWTRVPYSAAHHLLGQRERTSSFLWAHLPAPWCLTVELAMPPVPSLWACSLAIFGIGLGLWGRFQMFRLEQEKAGTDG